MTYFSRQTLGICTSFVLAFSCSVFAQHSSQHPNISHDPHAGHNHAPGEKCLTQIVHEERMASDAVYRAGVEAFEAATQEYIRNNPQTFQKTNEDGDNNATYVIPVVVHVVWGNPNQVPLGSDSISLAQVESQFEAFFEDMRLMPGTRGYSDIGFDTGIEFSLATRDPAGNPTTGVVYYNNPGLSDFDRNTEEPALKNGSISWDKSKYMNVWLVGQINGSLPGGGTILGYAAFPTNGLDDDNGVVQRTDCWGRVGSVGGPGGDNDLGRTGTHEMGHMVDLLHTFQSGCGSSNCTTTGDRVCDTPPQDQEFYGSPATRDNPCSNDFPDLLPNHRNYMDYSNDASTNHFTKGQGLRIVAALNNSQNTNMFPLWQTTNLQATGTGPFKKPVANFFAVEPQLMRTQNGSTNTDTLLRAVVAQGGIVEFENWSQGQPTIFSWSFPGGAPATSTSFRPQVAYSTPGTYDVSLVVTNASGLSDTITRENFVVVTDDIRNLPLSEDFESLQKSDTVPSGWLIQDNDYRANFALTWEVLGVVGSLQHGGFGNSKKSMIVDNYQYNNYGAKDGLVSPLLNADVPCIQVSYDLHYIPLRTDFLANVTQLNDSLSVFTTVNNGLSWERSYTDGGSSLSTGAESWGESIFTYAIDPSVWRRDTVNIYLEDLYNTGTETLRVKFENTNAFGSTLRLDNIVIEEQPDTSVCKTTRRPEAPVLAQDIRVAPNPFNLATEVRFELVSPTDVRLRVLNIAGQEVYANALGQLPVGSHVASVPLPDATPGIYLLEVVAGGQRSSHKVVKY